MGTSLIIGRTTNGRGGVEYALPRSWPDGTSVTDINGAANAGLGNGAEAGKPGVYDTKNTGLGFKHDDGEFHKVELRNSPGRIECFNTNLKATAHTSTVLLNPLTADMSLLRPVRMDGGVRVSFFARITTSASSVTSPIIRPYWVWGEYDETNQRWFGVENIESVLSVTAYETAGITLTFPGSGTPATSNTLTLADSWWKSQNSAEYTNPGAPWLLVLHSTAGVATGSAMHGCVRISN